MLTTANKPLSTPHHHSAIKIEGNLISADLTGDLKGQNSTDFQLPKTIKLEDEIAFVWGEAKDYWHIFQRRKHRLGDNDTGTTITREYWVTPLLRLLGYHLVLQEKAEAIAGETYAISHRAVKHPTPELESPPIHIVGCHLSLDKRPPSGRPRLSPYALLQEYLNKTEHLWGLVTNGLQWRLLRDCSLMTRSVYVEFDLEQIFSNENFAEFTIFYRLFHRTRLPEGIEDVDKCLLEYYHQEALQQGGRVRDRLRDGVEQALVRLGSGFLQHRDSQTLREAQINPLTYYRQLLQLVYRLLFLMVAESRNLLLVGEDPEKARIYNEYYSISRLRNLAAKPLYTREGFCDLWEGLKVTFSLFDENGRGILLGLSPLNGDLFGSHTLSLLNECAIDNYDLLKAIADLSLYENKGQKRVVNYAALDVEELGSVYESLLDYTPKITLQQGIYAFKLLIGSDRKSTGSYYTPSQLVQPLIKSALEPVIKAKLANLSPSEQVEALLQLKICDPACGSGHLLLATARYLGKTLAKIRTQEAQPSPVAVRNGIRDVIQNCIYGVDLNPLAVDLCKVALWIEGFSTGLPLNFLDHRIKCGNSLVGILDTQVLQDGIPDGAYKAVIGDEKPRATQFKKRNRQEKKEVDQLSLFSTFTDNSDQYAQQFRTLGNIPETTPEEIKRKKAQYLANHSESNQGWWRDYAGANLWTAAFFTPLTGVDLALIPTSAALQQFLTQGIKTKLIQQANQLAQTQRFFHWCLEFPEVFTQGGFDCVLGNPPWERIKLQEKEFFATKDEAIAQAKNKAVREKLIKQLPQDNPELLAEFQEAKRHAEAQAKFVRESGRFPLTSRGDINTYAVFVETMRQLINPEGRVGAIAPTGIATDATCQQFFGDLITKGNLASLYDFENRKKIFTAVDSRMKFSLLTLTGKPTPTTDLAFFLTDAQAIEDKKRIIQLSPQAIALINPNTLTCPIFRTKIDAQLTLKIYQRVPVLENEKTQNNPWGILFMRMFDMSNDSHLFQNAPGEDLLPLYEAKMLHQFDHRWGSYESGVGSGEQGAGSREQGAGSREQGAGRRESGVGNRESGCRDVRLEEKMDANFTPQPRYWVHKTEVENRLAGKWDKDWLIGFRRNSRNNDERTFIFAITPKRGLGDSIFNIRLANNTQLISCLCGNFNILVFDFITRQKMGGTNMNFFIVKQLPVIPPDWYTEADLNFIIPRVLELVYTAWDMKPFAEDIWQEADREMRELIVRQWQQNQTQHPTPNTQHPTPNTPLPPFTWNQDRRCKIKAELDAKYAQLYGLTRDELRYILDPQEVYGEDFPGETFRVLKEKEIKKYGEYRTKRLVLAAWDLNYEN